MTAYGVDVVIDLRSPSEVLASPNPFAAGVGPAYAHRPLVDDANMRRLGEAEDMFDRYLMIVDNRPAAFREVFTTVAEADGGVLFHCFAGKDRTGLIAAMLLAVAGVTRDHIASDFARTDVRLATQYERWLSEAEPAKLEDMRNELRCPPERILGVLDHLERRWGGVEGYLEAAGMSSSTIDRVAAKLA